jgi:four helix bundle protein
MAAPITTFEDLECWRAARQLRVYVARTIVPALPNEEKFRLGDQLLRAARSITANIAEGYGRFHFLDNSKFCSNARGSCCEVLDHLITASDEGLMPDAMLLHARNLIEVTLRLLNGYMAYLKRAAAATKPINK